MKFLSDAPYLSKRDAFLSRYPRDLLVIALSLPFLVRPFPNTDPIALTPTALPPRLATAADSIGAES